jgi:hypothetical protein
MGRDPPGGETAPKEKKKSAHLPGFLRKGGIPPAEVKIGGNGKFSASNFWMGFVGATDGEPPDYFGPWAPQGGNVKNHYVGLKFVINGETHYGWARFNVQVRQPLKGSVQAILTGYAYETVANAPIVAGKTSGAEEAGAQPATLGKLAAGAAGR